MISSNGKVKLSEKGLLTPDNCVVALIDHQPQMLFGVSNFDHHKQHGGTREGHPGIRRPGRAHDGGDEKLQWEYLAPNKSCVSKSGAD